MKRYLFLFLFFMIALVGYVAFEYIKFNDGKLHVVFCDVGQGDAILITTPAKSQILIDGGPDASILDCLGEAMPFWDKTIDLLILTHPDSDHYGGVISLIDRYEVGEYYSNGFKSSAESYQLFESKLADENLTAKNLSVRDKFRDKSGVNLQILSPRLAKNREVDLNISDVRKNEFSVVVKLEYEDFSALLTGDAETNVLDDLVDAVGKVSVLKVPHHGSRDGISVNMLNSLIPDVAIISVGEGNRFGHPDEEILKTLIDNKIKIIRTDIDGDIKIVSDGKSYEIY